ncbi:MAG: amidohydrolase family protein [Gammaproteobacteria bacterium]|nr:amidohydrolase family protein [Gammaproteobacteria bacterium]
MRRIAFRNARIWDGVADAYLGIGSVAVENGVIVALGDRVAGDETRDMSGLTLVPGLIDAHVHMTLDPSLRTPEEQLAVPDEEVRRAMVERAEEMVRAGITTARDLGGGKWLEIDLRDRIDAGELTGPRLLCAGQPVTSVGGHCHFWGGEANDADAAAGVIERQAAHGVDLVKVMATGGMLTKGSSPRAAQFDAPSMSAIVGHANARGLDVAAHCHGTEGIAHAANAGVSTIEHCSWIGDDGRRSGYDPDVAAEIARRGILVSPTINAGWKRFVGGGGKFERAVKRTFADMRSAGVRLIASTDAGIPGVRHRDLARALPVFAHFAGLTAVEVLRSATSDCADALGLRGVTGRLARNHAADMVFVDGDPLDDIGALESPALVLARGREVEGK